MNIKPSTSEAQRRLRLDDDLDVTSDLQQAIEQAHAQVLQILDRTVLHPTQLELLSALLLDEFHNGIVCTPDIIAAQLLLVDTLVGANSQQDRDAKAKAAQNMLWPHRRVGV
jgi:hypothetical protein